MGCSATTSCPAITTQVLAIPSIPRSRYATYREEIREMYTIKRSITFNSTTGLFYGEEMNTTKDLVLIRVSRLPPTLSAVVATRLDIIKANETAWIHLLPYHKIGQTSYFLYLVTKTTAPAQHLLRAIISGNGFVVTETNLCLAFCPLFATVAKMHEAGIIHGQIGPNKILVINSNFYLYDPCVGTESNGDLIAENYAFLSPEELAGDAPSPESDVWALGATLYYLITGHTVFQPTTCADCIESSKRYEPNFSEPVWSLVSPSLTNLIQRMLCKDKRNRLTMADVIVHEWTQGSVVCIKDCVLLNNTTGVAIDYKHSLCMQKTLYTVAIDKYAPRIESLQIRFQEADLSRAGHIDYGTLVQRAFGGSDSKCEDCDFFWEDPIHYPSFITAALLLNSLVMTERLSVLVAQLAMKKPYLAGEDVKRMLNGIAHADYTAPGVFEDFVRTYQNPQREDATLRFEEFVGMCQSIQFAPVEGFIIGKFF